MPKTSTRRSKAFTRCWTCCRRHLKCDKAVPGCERCKISDLPCESYDLRLSWVPTALSTHRDGRLHSHRNFVIGNRRSVRSTTSAISPGDAGLDVKKIQRELNKKSSRQPDTSQGLFHVFKADEHVAMLSSAGTSLFEMENPISFCSETQEENAPINHSVQIPITDTNHLLESELSDTYLLDDCSTHEATEDADFAESLPGLLDITDMLGQQLSTDKAIFVLPGSDQTPDVSPIEDELAADTRMTVDLSTSLSLESWEILFIPSAQKELINYWSSYLCERLLAVNWFENPLRSLMLPLAFQGLQHARRVPDCRVALFHAICATSAYSIYKAKSESLYYQSLAARHYLSAVELLSYELNGGCSSNPLAMLALLFMIITCDSISGSTTGWRKHVETLARFLSLQMAVTQNLPLEQQHFLQILTCSTIFCGFDPGTVVVKYYLEDLPASHTIKILGLTPRLVALYRKIQDYLSDPESYDRERLELEIVLEQSHFQELNETCSSSGLQTRARHNFITLCYAMLIFFKRECQLRPPEELQELVSLGLFNLDAAIRQDPINTGVPLIWPFLVIAAECTDIKLQRKAVDLFLWLDAFRIEAFQHLRLVCLSIWEQRALLPWEANLRWQDVLKDDEVLDFAPF